jgi:hypothetical protein
MMKSGNEDRQANATADEGYLAGVRLLDLRRG